MVRSVPAPHKRLASSMAASILRKAGVSSITLVSRPAMVWTHTMPEKE